MNILIQIVSPFFCFILIGFIFGKIFDSKNNGIYWLNNFIIYLAVPAMLFSLLSKSPIREIANLEYILTTTTITVIIFTISLFYLLKIRKQDQGNATLYAASSSFGNVGYMGVPLMVALLGDKAIIPATLILTFDNIIHLILVPLSVGQAGSKSRFDQILYGIKELLKNPFLAATILGIIVSSYGIPLPSLIVNMSDQLANTAIPTALFSLGLSLSLAKFSGINLDKLFLIIMKLIIHPILVAIIMLSMGIFNPVWVATAIIMASLPTALTVYMLAEQYKKDAQAISSITLFGTIFSVVTISLVIYYVDLHLLKTGI